jgi:hypothetical protein
MNKSDKKNENGYKKHAHEEMSTEKVAQEK